MKKLLPIAISAVLATSTAIAAEDGWNVDVELGGSISHGNSQTQSLTVATDVKHRYARWQQDIGFTLFRSKSGEEIVSNRNTMEYQLRRGFLQQGYAFAIVSLEQDEPADLELLSSGVLGLGRVLVKRSGSDWEAELGYGAKSRTTLSTNVTEEEPIAYLAVKGMQQLNESSRVKFKLSSKLGTDNTATKGHVLVQTDLSERTALSVGYKMRHNTNITGALGENLDGVLSVTLSQRVK